VSDGEVGLPDPCPACGQLGYLSQIDLRRSLKHECCRRCGNMWSVAISTAETALPIPIHRSLSELLAEAAEGRG
jgi:hypothetical protein